MRPPCRLKTAGTFAVARKESRNGVVVLGILFASSFLLARRFFLNTGQKLVYVAPSVDSNLQEDRPGRSELALAAPCQCDAARFRGNTVEHDAGTSRARLT